MEFENKILMDLIDIERFVNFFSQTVQYLLIYFLYA